jgi:hypothetical protein
MTYSNVTQDRTSLEIALNDLVQIEEILIQIEAVHELASHLESVQTCSEIEETRSNLMVYISQLTGKMRGVMNGTGNTSCT